MSKIKTAVQTLVTNFSDDNLTSYQKENDYLNRTSRAILCSSMCYSLNSQLKYLNDSLLQIQSDLKEAVTSSNVSDTHDAYIQSKLDQIDMTEITVDQLEECFEAVKAEFKTTAQEEWKQVTKGDKEKELLNRKVSGARVSALQKLQASGIELDEKSIKILNSIA